MKQNLISIALAAAVLVLGSSLSYAANDTADAPQAATGKATAAAKTGHTETRHKIAASSKLVDINGASREQLMKLPGIGGAEADKIIAGRPYATKSHLVTQNIIPMGIFDKLRKRIIAKQPYKDGDKNAALYKKKK